jgi:type IV pilus assembly protein PilY1
VSCPSSSFCVAVDTLGNAVTFDGGVWSAPNKISPLPLAAVSCPTATFCAAVTFLGTAVTTQALNWAVQNSVDFDGDHITDYVYGGDVFGNVWRFDLTSDDPARWTVSGATAAAPLFSTGGEPLTSRIVVASVPDIAGAAPRVILGFGTGQRRVQTIDSAALYDQTASHAIYGVWDWDLAGWKAKAGAKAHYASLAAPQTVNRGKLLNQNVLKTVAGSGDVSGYRTVSRRKVCWAGTTACPGDSGQFGWVLPLPQAGEQVIYHPVIAYGMLLVNTTIPEESRPLSCDSSPASGYTMALTMGDGGAANASFFANAGNQFVSYDGEFVSGIGLGATGTPSIVSADGRPFMVEQTNKGVPVVEPINPPPGGLGGRLTWVELR